MRVGSGQTRFICEALLAMPRLFFDGRRTLAECLDAVETAVSGATGLDAVAGQRDIRGDLALPRRFELAAAFNRMRGIRMAQERYG